MFTLDESMSFKDNELIPLIETRVNDLRKASNAIMTCGPNRVHQLLSLPLKSEFLSSPKTPLSIQVELSISVSKHTVYQQHLSSDGDTK